MSVVHRREGESMVLTWLGVLAEEVAAIDAASVLHPTRLERRRSVLNSAKGQKLCVRETMEERGP